MKSWLPAGLIFVKAMTEFSQPTQSLCPVCLKRIPAFRTCCSLEDVFLEKQCPEHGKFRSIIWKGLPGFQDWSLPKIPTKPTISYTKKDQGCPFDCGLCPEHRQGSCTILLEVTGRCNLSCPVCFADAGTQAGTDPSLEIIREWYQAGQKAGGNCNIQLSGGEPTVRDDLPDIIALGKETGFSFIQLNTNGIRTGSDRNYLSALKQAGLSSVFLQFDGTKDSIYQKLRGRSLLAEKMEALHRFRECGIGIVLVPTLIPGINTGNIGEILKLAMEWTPAVRAVHFQPVSYFGRHYQYSAGCPDDHMRLTLPELMQAIEEQTGRMFKTGHFKPPGCENARCSFHGNYLITGKGKAMPIGRTGSQQNQTCCVKPVRAEEGAARAVAYTARQWAAPETPEADIVNSRCCNPSDTMNLDDFIARARTHTFSVSAMAFQDVWNLDLERVRDCCIHVMSPDKRLIPFCLYNLTDSKGKKLYRP
ncbi:radical SAM (seleno)protein TrsS [Desulfonema limicola]|uniref:radical SAM (seleno)protein TrsS n=1 Tax=Desulfonema limicola TaxID=45656 RepID=UPI001FE604D9|nr:radical SAM (seleno)protein TrsS [Desulfonema limicola]